MWTCEIDTGVVCCGGRADCQYRRETTILPKIGEAYATPTKKTDLVNHPPHYTSHPSGIECIQITRWMNFNCGNAMKYLWRAGLKNDDGGIEDLEKSIWYIKDEIARIKGLSK